MSAFHPKRTFEVARSTQRSRYRIGSPEAIVVLGYAHPVMTPPESFSTHAREHTIELIGETQSIGGDR